MYKILLIANNSNGDIMGHKVDLSKYKIRTDLAIESIEGEISGVVSKKYQENNITITDVIVDETGSKNINKKRGRYITIEFNDATDYDMSKKIEKIFSRELKKLFKVLNINGNSKCMVIGLGNNKSTPDSLGPLTINNIIVTRHLFELNDVDNGFRNVSAFIPGVMGTTGLETSEIIYSIVNKFKPDFIITIDALASQSIERVNKTIQITDTGIHPGSGVGNSRKEISYETLGIPVIAIGVPTVVDAVSIVSDTINYMFKHYSYSKKNVNNPLNKLMILPNYLNKKVEITKKDKTTLLGIVGALNNNEIRELLFEVLTPIGYNLMVTPKEVDFVIDKLGIILAHGINSALHLNVD